MRFKWLFGEGGQTRVCSIIAQTEGVSPYRGSQYTSSDYREALEQASISCSMSRKGNCWDNAVVESFFSTLKRELFLGESPMGRLKTSQAVFVYIEAYYNRKRRHSTLGYITPEEHEQKVLADQAAKCAA